MCKYRARVRTAATNIITLLARDLNGEQQLVTGWRFIMLLDVFFEDF
jgi:hypothetical protein